MSAIDDLATQLKLAVLQAGQIASTIQNTFPRISGTFTMANATLSPVTNNQVKASFVVGLTATNATGALTYRTNGLFLQAVTAGSGFVISTQSGSAIGTETFSYIGFSPS